MWRCENVEMKTVQKLYCNSEGLKRCSFRLKHPVQLKLFYSAKALKISETPHEVSETKV